jgi:hypothetical protein
MSKEQKYFLLIVVVFLASLYVTLFLFKKYALLTYGHFFETCRDIALGFFTSGTHYVGFILTAVVLLLTTGLFLKTLSSYVKTKRKLSELLEQKTSKLSVKMKMILERNKIQSNMLIVIASSWGYAFTIGWFAPQIVVSTHLVKNLNEKELEAVILHEFYHLKNKHPLLLIIGEILSSTLSLLPLLKELTTKMRIVIEREADDYVFKHQLTNKHLNMALDKVSFNNSFRVYPALSKRNSYKVNRINLALSLITVLTTLLLFKLPTETYAVQLDQNIKPSNCGLYTCSVHCQSEHFPQKSNVTSELQSIRTK